MKIFISTVAVFFLAFPLSAKGKVHLEKNTSTQISLGEDGKLVYADDERGNRLPDFSHVGYHSGEKPLPDVKTEITLHPASGDDTERIQAAINKIAKLRVNTNGYRGALLLKKGIYEVEGDIRIMDSGIVLRGEGQGKDGTIIIAKGYDHKKYKRTLINVGNRNRVELDDKSRQEISDDYVPIGSHSFDVVSAKGFTVGDRIVVFRPSTKEWISSIGCDKIKSKWTKVWDTEWKKDGKSPGFFYQRAGSSGRAFIPKKSSESWEEFQKRIPLSKDGKKYDTTVQWAPGSYDFYFERTIKEIKNNTITIDAPVVHSMEKKFGGGAIFKFDLRDRVQEVGIEDLRIVSEFAAPIEGHPYGDPKKQASSELHGWHGIVMNNNSENTWVRRVTGNYFGWSLVSLKGMHSTVTDCINLGHASKISGGRRYPFMISGQKNLIQRCITRVGRHEFVNQARTPGPNVFVDCIGIDSKSSAGPHHRYAVGNLYDNVKSGQYMESRNRGSSGSGHGWAGTQTIFYNCTAPSFKVDAPPGGISWVIGSDSKGMARILPPSLYYQQVLERLGQQALDKLTSKENLETLGRYIWAEKRLKNP